MKILETLKSVYAFFLQNRRGGTTTLIQKIAKKHDVYVLVAIEEERKLFGKKGVSVNNLMKLQGAAPKPILVDNHLMLEITKQALENIERLNHIADEAYRVSNEIEFLASNLKQFISSNSKTK